MELKNFYAVIYDKDNVLRSRFISEYEYKNRLYFDNRGYFLIQTESTHFSAIEDAIQSLERLVKIIYRRYFKFNRTLGGAIKEVENEYAEIQKQFAKEDTCL